jgi:hypothetical protein
MGATWAPTPGMTARAAEPSVPPVFCTGRLAPHVDGRLADDARIGILIRATQCPLREPATSADSMGAVAQWWRYPGPATSEGTADLVPASEGRLSEALLSAQPRRRTTAVVRPVQPEHDIRCSEGGTCNADLRSASCYLAVRPLSDPSRRFASRSAPGRSW